jgi:segregation and condensation protein B
MNRSHSTEILEALLLVTDRPLPASRLATVLPVKEHEVEGLVHELNSAYEASGRVFRIRNVAGGYRLYTEPEFESYVEALAVVTREARLSQAALETLAVVAYRQPVSKNDVEFVRGCDCDGVLRTLLSRRLVAIKGRSEAPGRPLLYVTTERFLEYFGLANLSDLPDWTEITALVGEDAAGRRLTLVRSSEQAESGLAPETADASLDESLDESSDLSPEEPSGNGADGFGELVEAAEDAIAVSPRDAN